MTPDSGITVSEIRAALGFVLDAVERDHGPRLVFDHDYYWSLPVTSSLVMSAPAPTLTVGQVSDDIEEARNIAAASASEVVAPWHALAHLIGILRAVEDLSLP